MKRTFICLLGMAAFAGYASEIQYVTARPSPCTTTANCTGPNMDGTYSEQLVGITIGDYGAVGTAPGHPQTTVARTYIGSAAITDTGFGVTLTPSLGMPGGVYQIDYNFNSLAGNTTTNAIFSAYCTNGTLSFDTTDKYQRVYGNPSSLWNKMGYVTNDPGSANPIIVFRYNSGFIGSGNRMLFDCWRFTLLEPCLAIPVVTVQGPLGVDSPIVYVEGVSNAATGITVYQDSGSGMLPIGAITTGIVGGRNPVPVSGLVKGAQVAATQTLGTQPGCVPTTGTIVGGGANPSVRIALSVQEATGTPTSIGAPMAGNANLHFLGASTVSGTAPVDAAIFYPSSDWQTVTFERIVARVGDSANVTGAPYASTGYYPNDTVSIVVYAYKTVNDTRIFSATGATSAVVSSNQDFAINWSWDAVPGAEGYRLLRTWNQAGGITTAADVVGANTFADVNESFVWQAETLVTPTFMQTSPSIQWNNGTATNLPGTWGALDAIAFCINDTTDTGPFDIYIDNLMNGTTVLHSFEDAPAGMAGYGFEQPGYSGTTSGNILAWNVGEVSNVTADTGSKSLRARWQWTKLTSSTWLRFTAYGATSPFGNTGTSRPTLNFDQPISFRMLMQPVGAPPPTPTAKPVITTSKVDGQIVLNWTGGHRLQAAPSLTDTFTNLPQVMLPPNTNTYVGPWTNGFTDPMMFFRLRD